MNEVKLVTVEFHGMTKGVEVKCPWCGWRTPRARSYFGTKKQTFRCNHCYSLYRVRFAGEKNKKGE